MTRHTAAALAAALALVVARDAAADEQLLIKNPGDHPRYTADLEPHVLVGFGDRFAPGGVPGLGFRGTMVLVQDGFVKNINNSVGLGVGVDGYFFRGGAGVIVPVVMQWSFWLSTHWAVFGEPGLAFQSAGPSVVLPIFAVGGRYHFTERIALTMRIGYQSLSVGVSFYL